MTGRHGSTVHEPECNSQSTNRLRHGPAQMKMNLRCHETRLAIVHRLLGCFLVFFCPVWCSCTCSDRQSPCIFHFLPSRQCKEGSPEVDKDTLSCLRSQVANLVSTWPNGCLEHQVEGKRSRDFMICVWCFDAILHKCISQLLYIELLHSCKQIMDLLQGCRSSKVVIQYQKATLWQAKGWR